MSRKEDLDSGLWTRPRFEELSLEAGMLYIWSWSNTHTGLAGLFEIGRRTMAAESKVPPERLDAALQELDAAGYAHYLDGVMWAPTRVARLRPHSRPMATGVVRALGAIDARHPLRARWMEMYGDAAWLRDALAEAQLNLTGTSGDVHESPDSVGDLGNVGRPSPDVPQNVHGRGKSTTTTLTETDTAARAAGAIVQHQLPDGFPPHLADRAERVAAMLGALHPRLCRTGAAPPTLYRVGLAVRAYPAVDHVGLVHQLELWAMEPRRLRKGDLDLATSYRSFCENAARDAGGGAPAGGGPSPGGGPQSAADVMAARERLRREGAPA